MSKEKNKPPTKGELHQFNNLVLFTTQNGKVNIDVYFQDETLWLTQKTIAELFEKYRVIQDKNYESDFDREIKKWIAPKK